MTLGAQSSAPPSVTQSENTPQQSARPVHGSPSAAQFGEQVKPPDPSKQLVEQHWLPSAQLAPSALHGVVAA
jgi:hypothetical protein